MRFARRMALLLAGDLRQVRYHLRQARQLLEIGDVTDAIRHLDLAEEILTGE